MKKKVEIVFNEKIVFDEKCDSILELQEGDKFYFSMQGTTPRSENDYKEMLKKEFPLKDDFINSFLKQLNTTCDEHHIKEFVVKNITKGLHKDYSLSVENPEIIFTQTITVEEVL